MTSTSTLTILFCVLSLNSTPRPSWREDHILLQRTFWMVLLSTCMPPNASLLPNALPHPPPTAIELLHSVLTFFTICPQALTTNSLDCSHAIFFEPDDGKHPSYLRASKPHAHGLHTKREIFQPIILSPGHQIERGILQTIFKSKILYLLVLSYHAYPPFHALRLQHCLHSLRGKKPNSVVPYALLLSHIAYITSIHHSEKKKPKTPHPLRVPQPCPSKIFNLTLPTPP